MIQRLTSVQIGLLVAYALGMVGGQMLFKLAALQIPREGAAFDRAFSLARNGYFLMALAAYFLLALLWVWILSFTPLSRSYPFAALAFVFTPLLGGLLFGEPLSARLLAGIVAIACGLLLVAR
jgi:drug/metabolite transporter (DMT)-like permease